MRIRQFGAGRRAAVIAVVGASLLLAGCGGGGGGSDDAASSGDFTLKIGTATDAQSIDPPNFSSTSDTVRIDLFYERLIKLNEDRSFDPWLATSWKQDSDTAWSFELRDGVKFTDGTEFNAEAVKTSLERAITQPQGAGVLGVIKSVEVTGPLAITINLSKPFSGILNNLSMPVAGIVSPKAIAEKADSLATMPDGTGAYTLASWTQDDRMVLERKADYWGEAPNPAKVEIISIPEASTRYSALQSGEVDIIENPPPSERDSMGSMGITEILEPAAQPVFLGFNLDKVKDVRVRKAIAMAIDKEGIANDVLEGVATPATKGLIPSQLITAADEPVNIDYDPAAAKALIDEAGAAGTKIDLVMPTNKYLKDKEVGEVINSQLSKIGITANLVFQEAGTWYTSLLEHKTQMYWLGWGMTAGDPADMMTRVFLGGAVNNMSNYSGSDADIQKLATLKVGSPERDALLNDIQRKLVEEEVVVVPIYQSVNFLAAREGVKNFHTVRSNQWDISGVTVKN